MLDVRINGGTVVDGTTAPGVRADVGIKNGRVVAVGKITDDAAETIDADGLVVGPGFVDLHTHYDAQAFWDTTLSPSPLHGVTTVFGGNCGFTIAPLRPADGDYLMRMLARVEGMPLESLQLGVPWNWQSTGEYLDLLDGTLMPNAGFLVGHSALRRVVMHDDATKREATAIEIAAMCTLLREGLASGGLGFSSTWSVTHTDHEGEPVPSRHASPEELLALCSVVKEFPGTTLEFIPGIAPFTEELFDMMSKMSVAAQRPLNWNMLQVYGQNRAQTDHQLRASDWAAERGGRVVALTLPDSFRLRLTFLSGFVLDILPNWAKFVTLPVDERLAILRNPERRAELNEWAQSAPEAQRPIANWASYRLETFSDSTLAYNGRTVGEVAQELGKTAWDTVCDIAVADDLRTGFFSADRGQDDASWERRVEVWRDGRAVVGASDAGAHLDMIDSFAYSTLMLGQAVRQRNLLPIEEAISLITSVPADLYGVVDRGRLRVGAHADVVVLDPTTIGCGPVHTRFDLPGGAGRLYAEAVGIEHVLVNGQRVVDHGKFTEARPGKLLRSGRDTVTVAV